MGSMKVWCSMSGQLFVKEEIKANPPLGIIIGAYYVSITLYFFIIMKSILMANGGGALHVGYEEVLFSD